MKTKKLSKKLVLNKKTVSNLNLSYLKSVKGGLTYKCPTDILICDTYAEECLTLGICGTDYTICYCQTENTICYCI
jgi:predicted component of type VI protein secretion system